MRSYFVNVSTILKVTAPGCAMRPLKIWYVNVNMSSGEASLYIVLNGSCSLVEEVIILTSSSQSAARSMSCNSNAMVKILVYLSKKWGENFDHRMLNRCGFSKFPFVSYV
jgi:hypothetical protein